MAVGVRRSYYRGHRFLLEVHGRGDGSFFTSAMQIYVDPFRDLLWIGAGHCVEEAAISTLLDDAYVVTVWLLPPRNEKAPARKVRCPVAKLHRYPLDLDTASDSVAMDWVAIDPGPSGIGRWVDVPYQILPVEVVMSHEF